MIMLFCLYLFADAVNIERTTEWNIQRIMADSCWAAGYDGESVYVALVSGWIDTAHVALQGNISRWIKRWGSGAPSNGSTHIAGVICGGDGLGPFQSDIGVAPKAQLVIATPDSAPSMDSVIQWIVNLKADSGVNIRVMYFPGGSTNPLDLSWWLYCAVLKSMDILPVFSIGNLGPSPGTACSPGNYPLTIGIGGTRNNDTICSFSSRGPAPDTIPWNQPSEWYRSDWNLTKPDIVAPAQSIRSCILNNNYITLTGTSVGAPHVAGAVAILCQAAPELTVTEIYNLLLDNADRPAHGAPYPNNNYGWGRLNVWNALRNVLAVKEKRKNTLPFSQPSTTIMRSNLLHVQFENCLIFNICGQKININDKNICTGIYFVEKDGVIIQKVLLLR